MTLHLIGWALLSLGCHDPKATDSSNLDPVVWKSVSTNGWATCGIRTDGTIACWGNEGLKPAESPESGCEDYPRCDWGSANPPDANFAQVEMANLAGGWGGESFHHSFACGVTTDGHILCWGQNDLGQATPPEDSDFTQVSVMEGAACGLQSDGTVTCWGSSGFYGSGFEGKTYAFIETTGTLNCGIEMDGTWSCWKLSTLPYGPDEGTVSDPPPDGTFRRIGASGDAACAVDTSGALSCIGFWKGSGEYLDDRLYCEPVVDPSQPAKDIEMGVANAILLMEDGSIDESIAIGVVDDVLPGTWSHMSYSVYNLCAVSTDGALSCTGTCSYGSCEVPE